MIIILICRRENRQREVRNVRIFTQLAVCGRTQLQVLHLPVLGGSWPYYSNPTHLLEESS